MLFMVYDRSSIQGLEYRNLMKARIFDYTDIETPIKVF